MSTLYQSYFGLSAAPFSIAPAPRFLYMSPRHKEALAHLLYGLDGDGGFVLLTGEVGTGKTTICRSLLEQMPDACDVAYIFNPRLTAEELLATIRAEFAIEAPAGPASIKVHIDRINAHLLDTHARGRHAVLIIDEAQNLSADVLEQIRLLTNLETSERKLLQIILIGQPELAAMLDRPELRQLAQRIVARYHLDALGKAEVAAYIQHRLDVAGTQRPLFPRSVIGQIHRLSGGIPRVINVLCDRALLGAYAQGKERVDRATLAQAAREVFNRPTARRRVAWYALAAGLFLLAGGAVALYRPAPDKIEAKPVPAVASKPVPPAPAASLVAALPEQLTWPADVARGDSEALARVALLHAWGASYLGTDLCQQANAQGLRCRHGLAGLDVLRALNRPALLLLRDRQGQEFHAVLTALSADRATFSVGGKTRSVAPSALATQWTGRYSLLWRAPPALQDTVRPGDNGAAVAALRGLVGQIRGDKSGEVKPAGHYDDTLVAQVKQFQFEQGLVPDGCVGEQTLLRLVGVADRAAPRLTGAN